MNSIKKQRQSVGDSLNQLQGGGEKTSANNSLSIKVTKKQVPKSERSTPDLKQVRQKKPKGRGIVPDGVTTFMFDPSF